MTAPQFEFYAAVRASHTAIVHTASGQIAAWARQDGRESRRPGLSALRPSVSDMEILLACFYIAGAVLQTSALVRYLARATRDVAAVELKVAERGYAHTDWDDFDDHHGSDIRTPARRRKTDFRIDVALIGGGAGLGALGSVVSLWA